MTHEVKGRTIIVRFPAIYDSGWHADSRRSFWYILYDDRIGSDFSVCPYSDPTNNFGTSEYLDVILYRWALIFVVISNRYLLIDPAILAYSIRYHNRAEPVLND